MIDSVCKTRLYSIWNGMKQRCYNERFSQYKNYGGRGISVCDEWKDDFFSFAEWALSHGYQDPPEAEKGNRGGALSIDRIDNDKGYSPENCQWIPLRENVKKRKRMGLSDNCVRMTMRIPHRLNEFIEEEAKRLGTSRNAFIISVCADYYKGGAENGRP